MIHTFLFEEADWSATGYIVDETGRRIDVTGSSVIRHTGKEWSNSGDMVIPSDPPVRLEHNYRIQPLQAGRDETTWASDRFAGMMVLVGDSIFSMGRSADGRQQTVEYLQQLTPGRYLNRGAWLVDGRRMSSWVVELARVQA